MVHSAGKQTNAMLAFPYWIRENAAKFMELRLNSMDFNCKVALFHALQDVAGSEDDRLEMLTLSTTAKEKLVADGQSFDTSAKMMIADLLLIGINKNEQHVKSVAANYRRSRAGPPRLASTTSGETAVPDELTTDEQTEEAEEQ